MPQAVEVHAVEGVPRRLRLGNGVWQDMTLARRPWRVEQHWWRADPVRRIYYRVLPTDGPPLTIFYDEAAQTWYRQEY